MGDAASGLDTLSTEGPEAAISRLPTGITAFIGRTLKGPVNLPVIVESFAEYTQIFGGLWQPSTLSYAVEQYFDNGGRKAIVVRVTNGARPPSLSLKAGTGELTLVGLAPGSREYLRASVDYDGIGAHEPDRFNLVIQRVRAPASELVEDQEIFRRLTISPEGERNVVAALLESRLARVRGPLPAMRPDRSPSAYPGAAVGYTACNADGDDGEKLTDYDIIGSGREHAGLSALEGAPAFDLLCLPPLSRAQDTGLAALLVAARLCRERHAVLVVDPPASWLSAEQAIRELRRWPFRSDHAVMYFPRVLAFDRLRGRHESFASCGAAAGLLARGDDAQPLWSAAEIEEPVLRPGSRVACSVSDTERVRLAQLGVNTLQTVRSQNRTSSSARTLAAGGSGTPDWTWLPARRLASFIVASIERATRWLVFEPGSAASRERAVRQTTTFLDALDVDGAFAGASAAESFFVICDERVNPPELAIEGTVCLLFGFAIKRPGDFHAFLVTHTRAGSRVRQVSVNRMATNGPRVDEEIENALMRGHA